MNFVWTQHTEQTGNGAMEPSGLDSITCTIVGVLLPGVRGDGETR